MPVQEQIPVTAVVGASGLTGQECVRKLLELTNHVVRAVVRDVEKARAALPVNDRLTIVEGDVSKSYMIRKALSDCDYVIFAATSKTYWAPECVDYKGVVAVARAVEELQISRMVLISSMLVSPHNRWHPARIMLNNVRYGLMDFKFEGEQILRQSNISYTIIRPGGLNSINTSERAVLTGQGDNGQVKGNISRAELATVCVSALSNPAADRVTVEVVGGSILEPGQSLAPLTASMWSSLKPDPMPEVTSPQWVSDLDAAVRAQRPPEAKAGCTSKGPTIVTIDCGAPDPAEADDDDEGHYRCSG